ncbi:hypothetical protein BMS3Bbin05_00588 [bacterium BMS3Bbin05]|nr:hypothetical protein BMS3Bbin05_00588 [bacterium BMS3Bbin05]
MNVLTKRYGTFGWQEFIQQKKDLLREYDSVKEKIVNRPVKTEHGNAAEACFRKWLMDFLPKKYGVTSGYVIPDLRSLEYTLKHYDVIIFDAINSPILWGETNFDKSNQGKSRAIPAEYVHSILEVKSTLTLKSIKDAKEKLKELNDSSSLLNQNYSSGIVFFEIKNKQQDKCELAENLFDADIAGYFGGAILRAEGLDENITGYYQFMKHEKTEYAMPFVREIGGLEIDDRGKPCLTKQGDYCEAVALEDRWNFDKGYTPIVKNIHLCWSYNAFPHFILDTLERLEGKFSPNDNSKKNHYGMSYIRS